MQANGESNADTCAYNDLALVKLDPADVGKVNPSVPGFGGPTGRGRDLGDRRRRLLLRELVAALRHHSAEPQEGPRWWRPRATAGAARSTRSRPGIPGDSGSGFLNASGQAIGVLSHGGARAPGGLERGRRPEPGARLRAGSRAADLQVANGTEPFTTDGRRDPRRRIASHDKNQRNTRAPPTARARGVSMSAVAAAETALPGRLGSSSGGRCHPAASLPPRCDAHRHAARRRHRPGDHGRRRVRAARCVGDFEFDEHLVGGASIDAHGTALTDEVLDACRGADAVLLAAVGGPKWDTTDPAAPRPEQGLLGLRKGLGPVREPAPGPASPALLDASPLKRERIEGTDLLVVRELTGGIYFGDRGSTATRAHDTCVYSVAEIERIARVGFKLGAQEGHQRGQGERPRDLAAVAQGGQPRGRGFEDIPLEHMLVDNAAMQLVSRPAEFDVILTENMFGDILSDEAAMLTGSLGMLPSASLGDGGARPVRAGPRLGARHRRHRHRQPAGHVRLGGDDAAPRTGYGERGRCPRIGRRPRARGMASGPRTWAATPPQRTPPGRSSQTSEGAQYVNTADLIWLNGEFVAWEDAKVHVLTHALHYGTGVFEGIRAYETERGTAIFRHPDHLDRLEPSAKLYYMDLPVPARSSCARSRTS